VKQQPKQDHHDDHDDHDDHHDDHGHDSHGHHQASMVESVKKFVIGLEESAINLLSGLLGGKKKH
jgi:hypothetical protein